MFQLKFQSFEKWDENKLYLKPSLRLKPFKYNKNFGCDYGENRLYNYTDYGGEER